MRGPARSAQLSTARTRRSACLGMYEGAEPLISAELRSALKTASEHACQCVSMHVPNALNSHDRTFT
jgi:hypothetical protein